MASNKPNGRKDQNRKTSSKTGGDDQHSNDDTSKDEHDGEDSSPGPTKSSLNREKKSKESDQDNTANIMALNQSTIRLVKKLKDVIGNQGSANGALTKVYIEEQVANIREKQYNGSDNAEQWEKLVRSNDQKYPKDLLYRARAYTDDQNLIVDIIANMKKTDSADKTCEDQNPAKTSLNELIIPFKKFTKQECSTVLDLYRAVLNMDGDEINRADRMFYAEMRNLIDDPENYTFENAHDQVQAIRLMHYNIENEKDLRCLVKKHRNFDDAYSFLQKLMKKRMNRSSEGPAASCSRRSDDANDSGGSNPRESDGDNRTTSDSSSRQIDSSEGHTSTGNDGLYNSSRARRGRK